MDERHYVGIDVHQGKCLWCLVNPDGAVLGEGTVRTDLAGLDLMGREWKRLGAREVRVGLEASTAGKAVARHLTKCGWDVWMAHPRKLKAITTSETKTDRNDARALAHLVRLNYFPRAYLPSDEVQRLRDLVRMREEQVGKLRRTKQQLRALLVGHHLNHKAAEYDDLFGVQALRWLKEVDPPSRSSSTGWRCCSRRERSTSVRSRPSPTSLPRSRSTRRPCGSSRAFPGSTMCWR